MSRRFRGWFFGLVPLVRPSGGLDSRRFLVGVRRWLRGGGPPRQRALRCVFSVLYALMLAGVIMLCAQAWSLMGK